jgi:DNA-binding CsgD family transcriptional regulator
MEAFLQQYSVLVELIYDAAINPSAWPLFLEALSKAFEGATGLLHHYDASLKMAPTFHDFGHDPKFIQSYAAHYALINPYPAESFGRLPTAKVNYAGTLLPAESVTSTEFYNDWMKPQGISPNHLGVVLSRTEDVMALLCVAPQDRIFDRNPNDFGDRLQLLVPHLTKALQLNRTLGAAGFAHAASNAMLDKIPAAVFLLRASDQLLFANARAEELLQNGHVVKVDSVTRKLRAFSARDSSRFEKAIEKAKTLNQPQVLRVVAGPSGAAHIVTALPLKSRTNKAVLGQEGAHGVAIVITTSSCQLDLRVEDIQAATDLTPAEARLAKALVSGATLAEYADASSLSINTVRRHLAAAFSKTDTSRQGELIALLIRALGMNV